ncbi:citrate lyase subunit alpha, partial [Paenibacillus polymyxa]|nr:citrate lyase subunit alpha [Paenibacillus polymyxa]
SLAVARFLREAMSQQHIKASFALGGITNSMVELLKEGLVEKVIDVQDFDHPSAVSLGENADHYEIDANMYASPLSKGAVINQLDIAILSALEIDTDFNVNVITGSDRSE